MEESFFEGSLLMRLAVACVVCIILMWFVFDKDE